jgi:uncharacterized protein (TIGR02646 family)
MISIIKSGGSPASLANGIALTAADCARYDANSKSYRRGRAKFKFASSVYGSSKVKNALKRAQHNKCCYCEAIFEANYAGDVDHYRPKGAIGSGKNRIRPGYYWLAYLWSNLYYACADCNQYRKRAAFPLVDEGRRALDHHANLARENPLILDPGGAKNPRDHIKFKLDVPMGISRAGRTTVDLIKLDREALCRSRRKHFKLLDALLEIIALLRHENRPKYIRAVRKARSSLKDYLKPEAEFCAATEDYLEPFRYLWDVP